MYTSFNQYMKPVPKDEIAHLNDRQMINSRLYPLSPIGITTLYAISLYAAAIGSGPSEYSLFPTIIENSWVIKRMGVHLVDLLNTGGSARLDKGLFILLYLADGMSDTTLTLDVMDTVLKGYTGSGISVPVSRFLEMVATMASSCPDAGVRFYSYRLIQSVLRLSEDDVRVFVLTELLERCPYTSMHTAAIGLVKDQIHRSFEEYEETKKASVFTSPLVIKKFFPIIFKYKSEWKEDKAFWEDYNYIMQALNLYFYLLIRDKSTNLTTVLAIKDKITVDYIKPIKSRVENAMKTEKTPLNMMQLEMMLEVIDKINNQ
ncbi:hypothetical protein K501DRAFT_285371 [Backusella circina FSU 941]|nr:hypothetical protein K501DRAFT_285371 [Backusella circina FSU 941]